MSRAAPIELDDGPDPPQPFRSLGSSSQPATISQSIDLTSDAENEVVVAPSGSKREGKQRFVPPQGSAMKSEYVEIDLCGMSDDDDDG